MAETRLDTVAGLIRQTLGLGPDRTLEADTPLFEAMPEFDSLAVVALALAIEKRFAITIDQEDFTGELFATVGSLAAYVDGRVAAGAPVAATG